MQDVRKCEAEQRKLASKVSLRDEFSDIRMIAGAEAYAVGSRIIACVVVCDAKTLAIVDKAFATGRIARNILPEFLAYRDGPLLGNAISSLKEKPDIIFFDGDGVLHPRKIGLASHLGVMLDIPSIGISKAPLCGEVKGESVYLGKEKLGQLVRTKEHANPLCVSPGHRITLESAVALVKKCIREPHKMPEPLHLAHKLAKKEFLIERL